MLVKNIIWDTDGEYIPELPKEIEIPNGIDQEDIADYLSDKYGFCVFSYES